MRAAPLAIADVGVEIALPLLVIMCWTLIVLLASPPRHGRCAHRWDEWFAPQIGPVHADEQHSPPIDAPRRNLTGAALVRTTRASELPSLRDMAGHELAAAQLDDLVGPVLRAGRRPYARKWGGVLVACDSEADATTLVRAVTGEHGRPMLSVAARRIVRSEIASAAEAVVEYARDCAPCVLVVTGLHELAGDSASDVAARRAVSDLLTAVRAVGPADRLVTVGLVRDVADVPTTLRDVGGFDQVVTVEPLTADERDRILRREVPLHGALFDGEPGDAVAATDGLTASQLRHVVDTAVHAVRNRAVLSDAPAVVTARDLREAVRDADPASSYIVLEAFGPQIAERLKRLLEQLGDGLAGPAVGLFGATGNGKTAAARFVAERCGRLVVWLTGADLARLHRDDLDAIVDGVTAQAPVLVVFDGVDVAFAEADNATSKHLAATIEHLCAIPAVALLVTARDRWVPRCASHLDSLIESAFVRSPAFHERVQLLESRLRHTPRARIAEFAAQLHGATREDVVMASGNPDDWAVLS